MKNVLDNIRDIRIQNRIQNTSAIKIQAVSRGYLARTKPLRDLINQGEICSITLDIPKVSEACRLTCGHLFKAVALLENAIRSNRCPSCRSETINNSVDSLLRNHNNPKSVLEMVKRNFKKFNIDNDSSKKLLPTF